MDMLESIKMAVVGQKAFANSHTIMPTNDAFDIMTKNGAEALRLNAGIVKEGALADLLLVDLKKPELTPLHNLTSNIIYAANGSCVNTTIVDGKVLMRNRAVEGEDEIMEKASEAARNLVERE
jgi:5-methylthioadenosine/S-adenosylhomocysteine deaminase